MRKLTVCIMTILLFAGCLAKPQNTTGDIGQSENMMVCGNMLNCGFVLQGENSDIYFLELSNGGALGQLKCLADDKISTIAQNVGICYLYTDGWVYCTYGYNSYLARVDVNTGEVQILLESMCNNLILVNGVIYCTILPNNALYSMLPDGSQLTLLSPERTTNLIFDSNQIYFTSNNTLFSMNDGVVQEIIHGLDVKNFLVVMNRIYFVTSVGDLYVEDLDGTNMQLIWDHNVWSINIRNNKLVFIAVDDNAVARTYQYNSESGDIEIIYKNGFSNICVANNQIFEFVSSHGLLCIDNNEYIYEYTSTGA